MSLFSRLARLERHPPALTQWDTVRGMALEDVPLDVLRGFARNRVENRAFHVCLTPSEQTTYITTRDGAEADALLRVALVRLSEHFLDVREPQDDADVMQWFHAWSTRCSTRA